MPLVIGISRVRNESLIIADTIRHMEDHCDEILLYDDASVDDTVAVAIRAATKPLRVIRGDCWREDRLSEETRHRELLLGEAAASGADWVVCFDADERYSGGLRDHIERGEWDGIQARLFDAYLSEGYCQPYTGGPLAHLPRLYGPEERRILIAWRVGSLFWYEGLDCREPKYSPQARLLAGPVLAKHFGKAISVEQWEETCSYYAAHFPEPYRSKWAERRGKAIHVTSDFGRPLFEWPLNVAAAVDITPPAVSRCGRARKAYAVIRRAASWHRRLFEGRK